MSPELQGDLDNAIIDASDRNKIGITAPASLIAPHQAPLTVYEVTSGRVESGEQVAVVVNGNEGLLTEKTVVGIAEVSRENDKTIVSIGIERRVTDAKLGAVGAIARAAVEKLGDDGLIGEDEAITVGVEASGSAEQKAAIGILLARNNAPGVVYISVNSSSAAELSDVA
jgi:hypothetical protein